MGLNYSDYPLITHGSIRLIQIKPRGDAEDPHSTPIALSLRVVSLDAAELLEGESAQPPERPTVRFDEDVTKRPQEFFLVKAKSRVNVDRKGPGKFSRFLSKVKGKAEPDESVPLTDPLLGEPVRRDRFRWGNYVAMSYAWGPKEGWEMSKEEREEEETKMKDHPPGPDDVDSTPVLQADVKEVVIDGQRVRVRHNLWAALLRFRELSQFKQGVWVWNDALCINQRDEIEKFDQLQLMSEIYRQAGNIVVDVGDNWHRDEDTPWIVEYLQDISVYYRTELYEAMDHADSVAAHEFRYRAKRKLDESAQEWAEQARAELRPKARQYDNDYASICMYDFFDRPYWRRLWIIQELAMGHPSLPIVCGGYVTQWRYIRDAALLLSLIGDSITDAMQRALMRSGREMKREPSFQHVAAIAQLSTFGRRRALGDTKGQAPGPSAVMNHITDNLPILPHFQTLQGSPIMQALLLAANASCAYAKDRVHGLLALPALSRLNTKLSRDMTPAEVYLQFAEACIRADKSLAIFALLDGSYDSTKEAMTLPFWCPRFHFQNKIGRIEGTWRAPGDSGSWQSGNLVNVYGWNDMTPNPRISGRELVCYGWIVDSVDGLGAMSESDRPKVGVRSRFRAGVVPHRFKPSWAEVSEDIKKQIWMTLVGGTGVNGLKAPESFKCLLDSFPDEWPESGFLYKRNWDFLQANGELEIDGKPLKSYFQLQPAQHYVEKSVDTIGEHEYHKLAEAHRAMEARTRFRRLMTTSNRALMGLVPTTTQQGDAIIILRHHSRPLIASCVIPDGAEEFDDEQSKFWIRGEAYIPGIMNGELAEEFENTPLESLTFN